MMKKGKFYQLFTPVLALALIGCSSDMPVDDETGGNQNDSKDALYMTVNVQLPVGRGSRSETTGPGTSSDGTEIGQKYENKVTSVLLVLADTDNKFICCADKSDGIPKASDGGQVTSVQSVSKSVLSAYYGDDNTLTSAQQFVNVFVFCNPTDALRRIFVGVSKGDESWHEQVCTLSEDPNGGADNAGIWGGASHQDGFLMSSYEIAKKRLPLNFSDWDNFTTKENPFKLTGNNTSGITGGDGSGLNNGDAIRVERSVARFDFRDGSPDSTGVNTYNVVFDNATPAKCLVQIQLTRMALVNMSKNFYYLRRVSGNGLATDATLCSAETVDNYVVDTDADAKADGTIISGKKYADHFNFCLGNSTGEWTIDEHARDQWYHSLIAKVLGTDAADDNDTPWNPGGTKGDYKIWRYVTENTIPKDPSNQMHGISTGVVFKGKMVSTSHDTSSALHEALAMDETAKDDDPILYAYGSDLYVRWTEVRAMAIKQGANSPMYKAVFGSPVTNTPKAADAAGNGAVYSDDATSADAKWDKWFNVTGDKSKDSLKTFKQAATGAGFTLYQRSDDNDSGSGYYCYYYYWNRHNNNNKPAVMGPMEFGVVRNNVYKLAVTKINRLGHPRISENDPDPEKPDNPDEDGDVYLSVSVEVMPWVVRINDIEF